MDPKSEKIEPYDETETRLFHPAQLPSSAPSSTSVERPLPALPQFQTMKRNPESQLTKDEFLASDSREDQPENGTPGDFEKAPPNVMATRRIVKVRRTIQRPTPESTTSDARPVNPFAAVQNPVAPNPITNAPNPVTEAPKPPNPFATTKLPVPAKEAAPAPASELESAKDTKADVVTKEAEDNAETVDEPKREEGEKTKHPVEVLEKPKEAADEKIEKENQPEKTTESKTEADPESKPRDPDTEEKPEEEANPAQTVTEPQKIETKNESDSTKKPDPSTNGAPTAAKDPVSSASPLNGKKSSELNSSATVVAQPVNVKSVAPKPITFGGISGSSPAKTFASAANSGEAANVFSFKPTTAAEPVPKEAAPAFKETQVETGEEDEEEVFRARAKLYSLETDDKGARSWKERGVGPLKLNKHKKSNSLRLLMRTEATLRVVLNTAVFPGFKLDQATERSLRLQGFETKEGGKKTRTAFLVKFATRDDVSSLVCAVEKYNKREGEK